MWQKSHDVSEMSTRGMMMRGWIGESLDIEFRKSINRSLPGIYFFFQIVTFRSYREILGEKFPEKNITSTHFNLFSMK